MDFTDKLDILYARRSSEDGKDGESIENQNHPLNGWFEKAL